MANTTVTPDIPPIYCKHCARRLATISPDGAVQAVSHKCAHSDDPSHSETNAHACTAAPTCACAPFDSLFAELRDAEREHQGLLSKKPNHGGRTRAHDRLRAAKIAFGNLVLEVQMQGTGTLDAVSHGEGDKRLELDGRVTSMSLGDAGEDSLMGEAEGPKRSSLGQGQMTQPVPRHSALPSQSRKRIQFTADVPDREDYRGSDEYCRTHSEYAPGRYTPSEGCVYLDTSGSNQTFLRFTGQRRVRDKWVDVEMQEEVENEDGAIVKAGPSKRKKRPSTQTESKGDAVEGATVDNDTNVSSRELRMARRTRGRELDTRAGDASIPRKRSRSRKNNDSSAMILAPSSDAQAITPLDAGVEIAPMKATESTCLMFQQTPQGIFTVQITGSSGDEMFNGADGTKSADRSEGKEAQIALVGPHGVPTIHGETVDDHLSISAVQRTAQRPDDGFPEERNGSAIPGTLHYSVAGSVFPSTVSDFASIEQQMAHRSPDTPATAPLLIPTTTQQHTIPPLSMDPDGLSSQTLQLITTAQDPGALHCNPTA